MIISKSVWSNPEQYFMHLFIPNIYTIFSALPLTLPFFSIKIKKSHLSKKYPMKKLSAIIIVLFVHSTLFAQSNKQYNNPILAGFYPDPSICKAGNNYYLVNSTFAYFPGIPVFQSKDLVNWKEIGHVITRPTQIDFTGAGVSRGLFAPAIRYNKGIFYVTCTLVDGKGNFVATAKNPAGPWSDPVWLPQINGIDPSLFFDDNDKAYIVYNSIPPNNISLYDGHRTLRLYEFDAVNLKVKGEEKILVNGGTDISKKPSWIEGPHIYKKDGAYILMAAQGGTGFDHSEVAFKSATIDGPYVPYSNNPILTQKHTGASNAFPISSTGHADLVETENGKWEAIFLGCRPYEGDYYNTGRETFLAPVEWKDGWPIINPGHETVQYHYVLPLPLQTKNIQKKYSGNLFYKDDFNKDTLSYGWLFLRTPKEKWYSLSERKGFLTMQVRAQTCSEKSNPSFIGHRQQNLFCYASTSIDFTAKKENEKAGLLIFQNENHFYFLCQSIENNNQVVQLYKSDDKGTETANMILVKSQSIAINSKKEIQLKIVATGNTYSFYYAVDNHTWILLTDKMDAKFLSTKVAGGFVGSLFALYATSSGIETNNKAYFNWFEYRGDDAVYK